MMTLKLAFREIKNNFKYWLLFILNLSIGLLGFTFILLFRNNVNSALELRSKTILSADMAISGRRALEGDEKEEVAEFLTGLYDKKTQLTEVYSMAKGQGSEGVKTRLTHIKAIAGEYPLIGEIKLESGEIFNIEFIEKLQDKPFVVISREVAHQFKLKKGDNLKIGETQFEVYGTLKADSTTSMRGMSLAPKVYIGKEHLKATELIQFGSVAWYTDFYLFKKESPVADIRLDLQKIIKDPAINVQSPKNSSQQIGRILNYLSDYLGLIGVVALLISTIGSSYLFQNYIFDRLNQIGIFKSLGLSALQITLSFCWVIVIFGSLSSIMALGVSQYFLPMALSFVQEWIVIDMQLDVSLEVIGGVLAVGIFSNLLICIPILLRLFKNKTVNLLAGNILENTNFRGLFYYIPGLLFLWGVAVWQAHSFKIGTLFTVSLFVVFSAVLFLLPKIFKFISQKLIGRLVTWPGSLSFGIASRIFLRNQVSSILTILSLSIGVTLLIIIGQIDSSLKSELTDSATTKPSLFLFDIQEEQVEELKNLARENDIPLMRPSPMIRARLIKKNGEEVKRQIKTDEEGFTTREEETQRRFNNRGVNLTYALKLNPSESLVSGEEFSGPYSGEGDVEVSLEKRYARRIGMKVGDTLTYDVLGVDVKGKVVNLRTVKWTSFLPNFFITLQPGLLDDAPKSFLTAVEKVDFERQLEIQDMIVEKFSNISILNVSEIITKILALFKAMAWAVNLMSVCCIIVGLFVLYSILQGQLMQKQKEFALQKIMGMDGNSIFRAIFIEYNYMILLSLIIGNGIGTTIAYTVSYLLLDGVFVFNWSFFFALNIGLILLGALVISVSFKLKYNKKVNHLLAE